MYLFIVNVTMSNVKCTFKTMADNNDDTDDSDEDVTIDQSMFLNIQIR